MIEVDADLIDQPALGFQTAEPTCVGRPEPVEAQ